MNIKMSFINDDNIAEVLHLFVLVVRYSTAADHLFGTIVLYDII